ncbi:MAG TPA: Cache 3/Cache 2 fusion domain-containing protein [Deltaproteobacteria bacterium]|nr:Cache 3/Cache 2 fusion domain-containing protein [Deltaproteobacteria bacterium]HXK47541.1 Cache 3/Cache 2 fusion domain-containing protein [Deltaproteobacteria bacterium]
MSDSRHTMRLTAKVALLGAGSVLVTAVALVALAVWQSGQYNRLAQSEVDALIDADLDHITQGVYNLVRTENEAVQQQVDSNLKVARHVLSGLGGVSLSGQPVTWPATNQFSNETHRIQLPRMLLGGRWIGQNTDPAVETPVVDEVTRLVGETATIFQRMNDAGDMLRVATTVRDEGGNRAIGTYIPAMNPDHTPNPVISAILKGKTYHGRAYVVDAWYLTAYEPIRDRSGTLVGMLYVGIKQKAVESRVRHAILQTMVGKTGYVYVLGGKGEDRGRYIISFKGERDGEDIWESRDSDGRFVIKAIINKAMTLKPGELATERYRWQNPGEVEPRWKVARLAYYEPWDWVIGTSVYEDELQYYSAFLSGGREKMTHIMGLAGLVITLLIGFVGILIAWNITYSVRQMTGVAEKISLGDLDQVVDVRSRDEIGVLARTFNIMAKRLKETMEGLRRSEEKYRGIYENALEGLFQTTIDGRFLSANPAMAYILGYDSPEEMMAGITDIRQQLYVDPEDRDAIISTILGHKSVVGREVQFYRRDGGKIWISISARMAFDVSGTPSFIEGFLTDISDRKHAENALAESRNYLDRIINSVADPLFVKDRQHRWVLLNNAMCKFMGHSREEILGKSDYDYFPQKEADVFRSKDEIVFATGEENINEEEITDARGVVHTVVTKKTLYTDEKGEKFIVAIIRDISERKKAEEEKKKLQDQLFQAQKMESMGTFAGGIAHDFNNILSAIIGYAELARDNINHSESVLDDLNEVLKAGDRARDLAKQILTFSRMTETEYSPIALRSVIDESLRMLRSVIPTTIEIRRDLADSGLIMSDPTQIHQVMMNLCTNAVHAMGEKGGLLEVSLHEVFIDGDSRGHDLDLIAGPYLRLSVRDTGQGMAPEVMEKMFEPYFTTKELGRGTGLGLALVHGITKSHGGSIRCTSAPGEGTTFEIFFPEIQSGKRQTGLSEKEDLPVGTERILYVDDEPVLAELARKMLGTLGYQVVAVTSSVDACELFGRDPEGFDLVITDMTMPGMTGDRLAQRLMEIRRDIPVILCTGYSEYISEEKARDIGVRKFIMKPLNMSVLATAVRKALDGG